MTICQIVITEPYSSYHEAIEVVILMDTHTCTHTIFTKDYTSKVDKYFFNRSLHVLIIF